MFRGLFEHFNDFNSTHVSVAIASFANFVPEIVELLGNRPKYAGNYEVKLLY